MGKRDRSVQDFEGGGAWYLDHFEASVMIRFHFNWCCMKVNGTFFPRVGNLNRAHKEVEEHTQAQLEGCAPHSRWAWGFPSSMFITTTSL